ncbi:MAG TPA: VacB/RNase II family 3'-5' exoribonuclease [Polyangiaceae bacterium]|nr:VacB/RNase II family 3'-5' exoribonuclease [Polyangiaceae bacterium]
MARSLPSQPEILRYLSTREQALDVAEITRGLELGAASRRKIKDLLAQLVLEGKLRSVQGDRYRVPFGARDLGSWEGLLSVHPRGFAFVNASGQEDVFIPPSGIGAALHGDTVRVAVVARTPRGPEGRVDAVVKRRNPRVSGVLRKRRKSCWLEPDDERIRGPIVVSERRSAERAGEGQPVARDGAAAVVEITRFPQSAEENPEGELIRVLGEQGEAEVEVAKILLRDNIQEDRDPAAQLEAERRAAELTPISLKDRADLRELPFLTIDPVDARDHDDAVFVERRASGYRAYVAIADVSEYVQPGSALDKDASERCFTTYLPDRAVPMLPRVLAAEHCSLLADQDRYCLCAIVDLDKTASVQRFRLVQGVIRVAALISYEDAAYTLGFMEGEPKNPRALSFKKQLRAANELAVKLRKLRLRRGSLDLDLPEPKVQLEPDTRRPVAISKRAKNPGIVGAYQLVEELMLLANERVARWLTSKRSPAVYRVHAPPDPERLEQLGLVARKLGVAFDEEATESPLGMSKWLKRLHKHPLRIVLEGMLLRSLKMAQYDTTNVGHYGLASECYVHFTSPIRRYPDLLVHRICKGLLRGTAGKPTPEQIEALRALAARCSEIERVVLQAEREVVDVYRCLLMQDKIGQVYEARVSGMAGSGFYAQIDEPFVDVLVRFESMGPDRYVASEDGLSMVGQRSQDRISLGDRLTLVIEDVGLARRTVFGRRVPPTRVIDAAEQAAASSPELEDGQRRRRSRRDPERAERLSQPPARSTPSRRAEAAAGRRRQGPKRGGRRDKGKFRGRDGLEQEEGGFRPRRRRR